MSGELDTSSSSINLNGTSSGTSPSISKRNAIKDKDSGELELSSDKITPLKTRGKTGKIPIRLVKENSKGSSLNLTLLPAKDETNNNTNTNINSNTNTNTNTNNNNSSTLAKSGDGLRTSMDIDNGTLDLNEAISEPSDDTTNTNNDNTNITNVNNDTNTNNNSRESPTNTVNSTKHNANIIANADALAHIPDDLLGILQDIFKKTYNGIQFIT